MTPEALIVRAEKARHILDDPLYQECMKTLENDIVEAWARTGIRDKEGQHELLLMLQTARKFSGIFQAILMTGEVERKQLQKPKLHRVLDRFVSQP